MRASWQLVSGYLRHRPLAAMLSIGLLALGVGLLSLIVLLDRQLVTQFDANLAGIDLVIGAKGSPLQLVTSSLYHADSPTGNVEVKDVKPFGRPGHPLIKQSVPLALGDSYRGRRIVGTTQEFFELYGAELSEGNVALSRFKVVAGSAAARRLELAIGEEFRSVHGLDDNPELEHGGEHRFSVSGILKPTGLVIDELLVTDLHTVWDSHDTRGSAHDDHDGHDHGAGNGHDHTHEPGDEKPWYEETDKAITALLARFSGRNTATLNFARNLNENTNLMAANPAIVMAQFGANVASAEDLIKALGLVILVCALLGLVVILLNALRERANDLSLLRAMGAKPRFVLGLVLLESLILAALGSVAGLIFGRVGLYLIGEQLRDKYALGVLEYSLTQQELLVLGGSLIAALLASLYPAWRAYSIDPGLSEEL